MAKSDKRSKSPELDRRSRSESRGRSPGPKSILNSVATPDRYTSAVPGKDAAGGLRSRLGKAGSAPAAAAAGKCGSGGGWKQLVRCLFDPSAARDLPPDSVALRTLEAVSLVLNLGAFYLIVSLNKKLFRDVEKGGYGLKGVATLTFFQYITSWAMLRMSGVQPKPFEDSEWKLRLLLIVIFGVAPLASNMSLLLNPVATYQLFKLLQTPLLAVVEVVTGFRALSLIRAALMLGVTGGVAVAELGGHGMNSGQSNAQIRSFDKNDDGQWDHKEFRRFLKESTDASPGLQFVNLDKNKDNFISGDEFDVMFPPPSRTQGLVWAAMAVVLASSFKMFTGKLVRRGMTPAQFLLNLLPYSGALLLLYALIFEQSTMGALVSGVDKGGLGYQGMAIFVMSGFAAYFVQFTQAVAVGTTSALSHALIGQAKTASMLLLSPIIYGEETTTRQLLGGGAAMASLVLYAYVNIKEMEAGAAKKQSDSKGVAGAAALSGNNTKPRGRSPGAG